MDLDDTPKEVSIHTINAKKFRLPDSLEALHHEGVEIIKKSNREKRDPRFDPKIDGVCFLEDWEDLDEQRQQMMSKLKKRITTCRDEEKKLKLMDALNLLKQRNATQKDLNLKRKVVKQVKAGQLEQAERGQTVKFLSKPQLKQKILDQRLKSMSNKQRSKYLNKRQHKATANKNLE
ncbi:rRNA biogenesis protein rrp36 [Cichlidogyrus casuarinus]|uniref:rRNA biogenesis protein RRP36 n=1 Tax=Cichlidogyrus casuarinus TaxID=1844966 RepID=A0ABD2PRQ0_9PLAT